MQTTTTLISHPSVPRLDTIDKIRRTILISYDEASVTMVETPHHETSVLIVTSPKIILIYSN